MGTTGLKASLVLAQNKPKSSSKQHKEKPKTVKRMKKPPQDEVIIEQAYVEAEQIIRLPENRLMKNICGLLALLKKKK